MLGWLGIGPGVAISVFANVESGIRYGWLAALWVGVPACRSPWRRSSWSGGCPARPVRPRLLPVPPVVKEAETVTDADADAEGEAASGPPDGSASGRACAPTP